MKKAAISISFIFLGLSMGAQEKINRKDTVQVDSTHLEKIKKMPMDSIHHKTPIKPVLPEEQRDDKERKDLEPIISPSGKKE
ncbi:MAG: hypothetical protein K0S44_1223 [Bacteroidetes bacterium]|jgi:hypothetical protein|nr:hypothetical protein [Bacteroidota bacterium]